MSAPSTSTASIIGFTKEAQIVWLVFAPGSVAKGALAGDYGGATASATVGAGVGANVLLGGSNKQITLQPVSVEGSVGLNVAAGVAAVTLKPAPPASGPLVDGGSIQTTARRLTPAGAELRDEVVAQEVAVALVYNGVSHAVMMATPCDLEDFARGFTLTEHLVEKPSEIYDIEVEPNAAAASRSISRSPPSACRRCRSGGAPWRAAPAAACAASTASRRRLRPVPATRATATVKRAAIARAMAALPPEQRINRDNGATHAAGWATLDGTLVTVREDVGRHNALDKLAGAIAKLGTLGEPGFVVVTSRCSYEMVQKAAAIDAAAIAAVSAPTSLAIETAEQAGLALVAFVRDNRLTVYAHGERIEA